MESKRSRSRPYSSLLVFATLLVGLAVLAASNQIPNVDVGDFSLDPSSNVLVHPVTNKSDHPFPYTASVIVASCLFGIAAIIICLGGDL